MRSSYLAPLIAGATALGLSLSQHEMDQFAQYAKELLAWNQVVNLTAIVDPGEIAVKHFLDSLSVLTVPITDRARVLDVGAGAGFPGIPLKIVRSDLRLALLESTGKKVRFLEHIVDCLELHDVQILHGRAEELAQNPTHREQFDVVVARAVAALPTLVELTLPFARVGGSVIAQKQGQIEAEVASMQRAIQILGGRNVQIKPLAVPGLPAERKLVVIEKAQPTPARYPRRPGMPDKRPL